MCRSKSFAGEARTRQAKAQPSRRQPDVDGKQLAAVCRIKALRRLHCCALPVCGLWEADRPAFLGIKRIGNPDSINAKPLRFASDGSMATA
jgi:hypothetical protein